MAYFKKLFLSLKHNTKSFHFLSSKRDFNQPPPPILKSCVRPCIVSVIEFDKNVCLLSYINLIEREKDGT